MILVMIVKDNNNLLSHNQWSAGEYENYPEIFYTAPMTDRICTNEYSSIGEQSIKLTKKADSGTYARASYDNSIINKTVTASAMIKTNNPGQLVLLEISGNTLITQNMVTIPAGSCAVFTVSLNSSNDNSRFGIQFSNHGDKYSSMYIDDLYLSIS